MIDVNLSRTTTGRLLLVLLFVNLLWSVPRVVHAQTWNDLNVGPDLFRLLINDDNDLVTLNLLADVSNLIFNPTRIRDLRESYDYVIVGSGPAGCVLANRLSEDASKTVLMIEAGQPESMVQKIPLLSSININTKYFRKYRIEKTENTCMNMIDQTCPYPIGEALGGSSVVNYFVYTRGNKDDFDRWEAKGGVEWGYADSMRLFDEFESSTAYAKDPNPNGTLSIESSPYESELLEYYLEAGSEVLRKDPLDYNAEDQMGIGVVQGTSKNGRRVSAADAYIAGVFGARPNLHILTNSMVTRILIDNSTKTATGVEFLNRRRFFRVQATREVIVSAGPIRSPQLLMVSGIGPRDHLLQNNVPFIHDLPVGGFSDHFSIVAPTFIVNTTNQSLNLKRILPRDFLRPPLGKGMSQSFLGLEAMAFHKLNSTERPPTCPDLELVFLSGGVHSDYGTGFRKTARIQQGVYNEFFRPLENTAIDAWSSIILHLHPRTRGRVSLRDNSMQSAPMVEYPFFDEVQDLEDLLEGVRIVQRYAQTRAMQSIGAQIYSKKVRGCEDEVFDSDDYWRCYIRHMVSIMLHMVGTNRMGPSEDPEAVVDGRLRVHGINKLRVADTSVIPMTVSGHPQAFSYLIGERAARFLKVDAMA